MDAADDVRAVEIGQRAGDLQHAVIAAGGEAHLFRRIPQQLQAARHPAAAMRLDQRRRGTGVGA